MVEATVGRGNLIVFLPEWLSANIAARSGAGVLDLLGHQSAGVNLVDELAVEGGGGGHLGLVLSVEQGSIVVVRS